MTENVTRKQHFVPQFYLREFTDVNGFLHVYNRETGKRFRSTPNSILYEEMLYETKWEGASELLGEYVLLNQIEHQLSASENRYSALLRKIKKLCETNEQTNALICNRKEKEELAELVANFYLRNPYVYSDIQEEYSDFENLEIFQEVSSLFNTLNLKSPHSLVEHAIKQGSLDPEVFGSPAYMMKKELLKMNLVFLKAKSNRFITSSFPVTGLILQLDTKQTKENKVFFFPISPEITVMYSCSPEMKARRNRLTTADDEFVQWINGQYSEMGTKQVKYLVAMCDEDLESFTKHTIPK